MAIGKKKIVQKQSQKKDPLYCIRHILLPVFILLCVKNKRRAMGKKKSAQKIIQNVDPEYSTKNVFSVMISTY